ncbi:unnamed protein product (macronuclear) [Paramecium tetraurelia]|uniref:PH domain-containing protein n=1 Tax=Paramecium tetraurelia TaxID=5888 RepID=A0E8U2_PARTE|nr:uncharacterized protein GSPATT00024440001 [Paramecium tetraurelia]CAK91709.1 unnamed protein product [Paramecium tetraurelia]|eukprot:XP_001459106.1 hypothetical protein (macronuclear) [Paramecium tetraurelia strain d4-2]
MSNNTLKKWMESFNDLLGDLTKKIQHSYDKSIKQQQKGEEGSNNDWIKYLPLNQLAFDNQDVYRMKYINDRFVLSQFIFQQRYDEQEYQVKLLNNVSETEILQEQYRNSIFEFCMNDNNALLLIKQSVKTNNSRSEQQQLLLIKEVYAGFIQDDKLYLYLIKNINLCQQAGFHPLNPNYLVLLQASQELNKQHTYQKEQQFLIFETRDLRQPIVRMNLNSAMNGNALAFSFASTEDPNSFLIYFLNNQGIIYYYEFILPNMTFRLQTKMYLQAQKQELVQFVKDKSEKEFKINYNFTTQDDYQKGSIKFQSFSNINYQLPKSNYVQFQKLAIADYYLFFIVSKQANEDIIVQAVIGKDLQTLYEIYQDEIRFPKSVDNDLLISHLRKCELPKIVYCSENVTYVVQNQFDLPNRHQLLLLYHNSLISIDFSNVVQYKQDQSPINVTCIDLLPFSSIDQSSSEQFILQVLCLDLYKSKQLLLRTTNKAQKQTFQLIPQKLLLGLTEQNSEINKIALDFYQAQNVYLMNKAILQQFKKYLVAISDKRLPQCKTEEDIISINEDLSTGFQKSIKGVAIKIKLESENMYNDIELKRKGDLTQQEERNLYLQKKISEKNEKINSLLERLQSTPSAVIRQQLINQQQQSDLEQFQLQFDKIQEQIRQNKRQLEDQIQISNRTKQEIEAIQSNLIQQILQKKD